MHILKERIIYCPPVVVTDGFYNGHPDAVAAVIV